MTAKLPKRNVIKEKNRWMFPVNAGNIPTPAAPMEEIARQDEKRRHPPLLRIKYTVARLKMPRRIMLMLKIVAEGSTTGIEPPRWLRVLCPTLYPGNNDSARFTANKNCMQPIISIIPAVL